MGGAVTVPGNVTPVAEANVYNDPEAAHMVLASGAMPRLIGLDVTHQALWRPAQQEAARQRVQQQSPPDPVARLAVELLDWYLRADLAAGLAGSPPARSRRSGGGHVAGPLYVGAATRLGRTG